MSIRRFRNFPSGCSGLRSLIGGTGRAFSLEVASFAPTYKFSEAPRALRTCFFARLGRFGARTCSPEGPQDAPGLDFGARNGCFFEVFACGKRSTRKTSDIDKTLAGAIRNALRSCRAVVENVQKSIRKRFRLRWAMRRALTGVLESSQTLLERLRSALRPPLGDSWPLWTRQGCPRIGFGAARGGSKGVPGRSGRVPETALGPYDGPRSILGRLGLDFL